MQTKAKASMEQKSNIKISKEKKMMDINNGYAA